MKFLADMGISPKTVGWLTQQGYDVTHLLDEGLEKLSDSQILEKARHENRVILTVTLILVPYWRSPKQDFLV